MFKKFSLWLLAFLFILSSIGLLSSYILVSLSKPVKIKNWVNNSGIYDSLGGIAINDAKTKQAESTTGTAFPISDPLVTKAAKTALSNDFYKTSFESVTDNTYKWLNKEQASPDFRIEIAPVKQKFVDTLANLVKQRYEGLKACGNNVLPSTQDLLKIDCRPDGLDIDQALASEKITLLNDDSLISSDPITADNIAGRGKETFFQKQPNLPKYYSAAMLLPKILAVTSLIYGLLFVLLASSKKWGLRMLGWQLIVVTIFNVILIIISQGGLYKLDSLAQQSSKGTVANNYSQEITKGLNSIRSDALMISLEVSGVAFVTGATLVLATRTKKNNESGKGKAQKPTTDTPKIESKVPEVSSKHRLPIKRPTVDGESQLTTSTAMPVDAPAVKPQPKRPNLIQ